MYDNKPDDYSNDSDKISVESLNNYSNDSSDIDFENDNESPLHQRSTIKLDNNSKVNLITKNIK